MCVVMSWRASWCSTSFFKRVLDIKGSIVECGVYQGAGVMAWAKLSEILEPYNFLRKVDGFDTFEGFPSVAEADRKSNQDVAKVGYLKPDFDVFAEMKVCIGALEETRLLKHQEKVLLVKGDAMQTIPAFLQDNQHVLVSLLYLDFDLYEPTLVALKEFMPRMPKGAIIAFDELRDAKWPGETRALLEAMNLNHHSSSVFHSSPTSAGSSFKAAGSSSEGMFRDARGAPKGGYFGQDCRALP
jgi:hypothetical protein